MGLSSVLPYWVRIYTITGYLKLIRILHDESGEGSNRIYWLKRKERPPVETVGALEVLLGLEDIDSALGVENVVVPSEERFDRPNALLGRHRFHEVLQ